MKKIVCVLMLPLLIASCGTKEVESSGKGGDVVLEQINKLMSDAEKGMKPLSKIAEVTTFDNNAKPYLREDNNSETGNFQSKWEDGDYKITRFYTKKYNDESLLQGVRVSVVLKDEAYYNPDTDEEDPSKKIDFDKYSKILSEKLGSQPSDYNGSKVWKTDKADWYMNQWDDYSLEFTMKK